MPALHDMDVKLTSVRSLTASPQRKTFRISPDLICFQVSILLYIRNSAKLACERQHLVCCWKS